MTKCPYCNGDESKCDFSFETDNCSQMKDGRDEAATLLRDRDGQLDVNAGVLDVPRRP